MWRLVSSSILSCGQPTVLWIKARFPLPEFTARVHGLSWRPVNSGAFFDSRQLGPSTRVSKNAPEFTGRQLGLWTLVVETGLKAYGVIQKRFDFDSLVKCFDSCISSQFFWNCSKTVGIVLILSYLKNYIFQEVCQGFWRYFVEVLLLADACVRRSVNTTVASTPYIHLCDPAADTFPLHFTSTDDVPGTQTPFGIQYISPVVGNLPYPAGHTLPTSQTGNFLTQPSGILHMHWIPAEHRGWDDRIVT